MQIAGLEQAIRDAIGERFESFYAVRTVKYMIDGETNLPVNIGFAMFDGTVHAPKHPGAWTCADVRNAIARVGKSPYAHGILDTSTLDRGFRPTSDTVDSWMKARSAWVEEHFATALQQLAAARQHDDEVRDNIRAMKRQRRDEAEAAEAAAIDLDNDDDAVSMFPAGMK